MGEDFTETYTEIALEQRLRTHVGTAFQRFFSDVMEKLYPDFQRVKPQGSLGDKGNDGIFLNGGTIHQCYGADNGHVQQAKQAAKKVVKDFETTRLARPGIKRWLFTHNLVDGLPDEFVSALLEVKALGAQHGIEVGKYGKEEFLADVRRLQPHEKNRILGMDAFHDDALERLPHSIKDIVNSIMDQVDTEEFVSLGPAKAVPIEKFEFNRIPRNWRTWLTAALQDAPIALDCISQHANPLAAGAVPDFFKMKYLEARLGNPSPGDILHKLHTMLVGGVRSLDTEGMRGYAGHVLLATMFESCQIFEDKEASTVLELVHDPAN
ncbi:hypothetical protein AB9F42_03905 [Rhizobium leguminosarum]|uniref:hypothetical protein n=1 Tax=Rhizobium leguminosarum TaxID=384 RepID=UPI003F9BD1FA